MGSADGDRQGTDRDTFEGAPPKPATSASAAPLSPVAAAAAAAGASPIASGNSSIQALMQFRDAKVAKRVLTKPGARKHH